MAKVLELQLQQPSFQWTFRTNFFRIDWLDLLAVQGTFKSLLQHHSSKASILWCSAFFIFQLSHPHMTTGKTIALTRWTFVGKVMSLLFNMLSRLVITFLPRSKRLLISWLQSTSVVILEPRKIKSATVSPSICHEVMGLDAMSVLDCVKLPARHFRESWTLCHCWVMPFLLLVPRTQKFTAGLSKPLGCGGYIKPTVAYGWWWEIPFSQLSFKLAYLGYEAVLLVPEVLHSSQGLSVSGPGSSSSFPRWNK